MAYNSPRPNVYVVSDTHFGHKKMVEPLRPFATVEEHDEELIERWNSTVRDYDIVYHLGDVVMNRWALGLCGRLNGRKRLVKGNHDMFRLDEYTPYFENVLGCLEYDGHILTHIPVHPGQFSRYEGNVHGHLHDRVVMNSDVPDTRYACVSMEQIDYRPKLLNEVIQNMRLSNLKH